ncbi:hypothetical protein QA645_02845 [Bradyrhizobium sp. CIAT3101]|uniref:hypothetical protein n=1 Tax=Bradyrhizobium sp. CIAT3101 TaxID=439387 RepID=UPI0024B0CD79|nr:hypothetical protein [Bradyrhizobium sp. CIAT3101]WFU81704.1 hypothetical protein QA645_02845 [Bradyrhizobium sp. CIAT3101]
MTTDILGTTAIGLVGIWLVLTLAYQYKPLGSKMGRFDYLRLLPSWTFFAPNPATRDYHLVVRDKLSDGNLTDWAEVAIVERRRQLDVIWHPAKRRRKILSDAAQSIKLLNRNVNTQAVQHSLPYLIILHYCMKHHPLPPSTVARQFGFVETSSRSDRKLWLSYLSDLHTV